MKIEHILEDIKETIVRVITNKENVQDFNDIVERLSKEEIFLGRNERDKQVPINLKDTLYIESGEQMKPHYITFALGIMVALMSYLLTKTLLNIEISAVIFIARFICIFIIIYGVMYLVNKSYMNRLNKLIKKH